MTAVEYTDQAIDDLESLDPAAQERILDKVEEAVDWTEHRLKPLGGVDLYSLRAGDYRALVDWDRSADRLTVVAVGYRRNVYDRNL